MENAEKINTIQRNIKDGLRVAHKPIEDHYLLTDLKLKMEIFDLALDGLLEKVKNEHIDPDDITNVILYWLNLSRNISRAGSLLEYVDRAIGSDNVELEDVKNYSFPIKAVKEDIETLREKYNR